MSVQDGTDACLILPNIIYVNSSFLKKERNYFNLKRKFAVPASYGTTLPAVIYPPPFKGSHYLSLHNVVSKPDSDFDSRLEKAFRANALYLLCPFAERSLFTNLWPLVESSPFINLPSTLFIYFLCIEEPLHIKSFLSCVLRCFASSWTSTWQCRTNRTTLMHSQDRLHKVILYLLTRVDWSIVSLIRFSHQFLSLPISHSVFCLSNRRKSRISIKPKDMARLA